MTSQSDWKASLTSANRYDTIQAIKDALCEIGVPAADAQKNAFSIENEAYKTSTSQNEYDSACRVGPQLGYANSQEGADEPQPTTETTETPGIRIGSYQDCQHIDDGVTAEVYKSKTVALKVIVQTRNIEPHDPFREAKILKLLKKPCIPLLDTFRDQEQRFVLVFPYMPVSLDSLIARGPISRERIISHFRDIFTALQYLHDQGIIHRDVKPSAVLLESPDGPAYLSDFGTAWHPELSVYTEPADQKVLDIGTGSYRSPEALFGNRAYDTGVDMWAAGAMLAECCRTPSKPLFESRPAHEDGNQLGLILSIFKTIGSPTRETWAEAASFKTPPFDMYRTFEGRKWEDLLPGVDPGFRDIVISLVKYSSNSRASASQVVHHECFSAGQI
ncbi:serine/threonine-protein kinase csk1 [Xylaria bambusicola]|uniref:serine/threonine-protein kinase csk1 n=1 Tax=Xylaria bambusicola TaxID=326684 RepID=UPI002007DB85|nr:serine/threonine-protein kinase csk1 [Xylaria bambusicola]KAI0506422.1 serine/threonine-protein kinase csk1 [Xylaria bambusicola]